jgi:hypothetical protein
MAVVISAAGDRGCRAACPAGCRGHFWLAGIQHAGGVVPRDSAGDSPALCGVFKLPGKGSVQLIGHYGCVRENIDRLAKKKFHGGRVDRDDGVDLYSVIFAAQVIGKCLGIGAIAKSRPIQLLVVQLDVEQRIRTKNRAVPLVGHIISRVCLVFAVKDQNPFRLYWLTGPQGLQERE